MSDDPQLRPGGAHPVGASGGADPRPAPSRGKVRRQRAPGAYLTLPLWQRFALAGVIAVVLLVAMVIFIDNNNTNSNPSLNEAGEVRANREAEILVKQDQAPHSIRLERGVAPAAALERALHARMAAQVADGVIDGPLRAAKCTATGAASGGRRPFSCTIVVGQVTYPFVGVVDVSARQVTYCKRDPPPAPSDNVPVSARCLG
jgi:hypothetical protein